MVSVSFFLSDVRNQNLQLKMFNFCKKMFFFYSFLGFSHSSDHDIDELHRIRRKISVFSPENCRCCGLSLLVVGEEGKEDCRNVVESSSIKPKSVVNTLKENVSKSFGLCSFLDEKNHGCKDGLSSCTESLGFESSDQIGEEEGEDRDREVVVVDKEELRVRLSWRRRLLLERVKHRDELMKNQIKKFPPPLSSLNQNGKPNFFLKHVRKDGRLELTEVPIDRPNEILRASRQDGRLRLHLVVPKETEEEIEEDEDEVEEENEVSEIQEMKFPLIGEGFRRCREIGNRRNHYQHHHLPIWKQHGVTTRSTVHVL